MIIAFMGTMIVLSLNEVPVDYGKNHCWVSHAWLFPPGSDKDVRYVYADDVVEVRPGLSAALEQVRFRMDHLGYSLDEVRDRYNCELERWNRTYTLCLPFERFLAAVISIDFVGMAQDSQGDFEYDKETTGGISKGSFQESMTLSASGFPCMCWCGAWPRDLPTAHCR